MAQRAAARFAFCKSAQPRSKVKLTLNASRHMAPHPHGFSDLFDVYTPPAAQYCALAGHIGTRRAATADEPLRQTGVEAAGDRVFGNRTEWIAGAIGRALARVEGFDIDVRVAHYRSVNEPLVDQVAHARATR